MAEVIDAAFAGVGQTEGLTLWRIEAKMVVKQPAVKGKFHEGDCYMLLATTEKGGRVAQAIHFWIGSECSQDEQGIAAYKTVELDDSLGGAAVQYRETQGRESPLFLSYFKRTGIEYLPGGVASGFNKMEKDVYRTRLLQVKGKRVVRSYEVPCSASSLTTGDVFILDVGLKLFLWTGSQANMYEKSKALQTMQRIKDSERAGRASMTFLEDDPENAEFWEILGGYMEVTAEGTSDDVVERAASDDIKLFQVTDSSGELVTQEVEAPGGNLTGDLLEAGDVYILDVGSELFVWVGRESSVEEKKSGMPYAAKYIEQTGRDLATPTSRLSQGFENPSFKSYFAKWNPPPVPSWDDVPASSKSPALEAASFVPVPNSGAIASGMWGATDQSGNEAVDDGSGKLEIWRVEDFQLAEWPQDKYGQFYGGDCYVMLYIYLVGEKEMYIIYFWQGRESTQDEVGASAILAKEMDDKLNDAAVQVRVVQGKEPKHMRSLFHGKLVVHSGGGASGFKNSTERDSYDTDGVCLFHVKGTQPDNTYGVQVPETASSLNSGDSFVLLTPSDVFTWVGRGCSAEEASVAEGIAETLVGHAGIPGRSLSTIAEGEEPEAFWSAVGGMGEYPEVSKGEAMAREPRLFHVSNATGKLSVVLVCNFDQSDLCADDVMLLDTFASVFVWVGAAANEIERAQAMDVAQEYIDTASDGRHPGTPISVVAPGNEPPMFTQHFRGWDATLTDKMTFSDPYEAKLAVAREEEAKKEAEMDEAPGTITMDDLPPPPGSNGAAAEGSSSMSSSGLTVPYADLKGYGKEMDGVDPSCREQFLSDTEFNEVFGMSKSDFAAQPKWKQVAAKKAKELF